MFVSPIHWFLLRVFNIKVNILALDTSKIIAYEELREEQTFQLHSN